METRENAIRRWFAAWVGGDGSALEDIFAADALYVECYGPAYKGSRQIAAWFADWLQNGRVLEWVIDGFAHQGSITVCRWHFACEYCGEKSAFNGASWIIFDDGGKIAELWEYRSDTPNYFPYDRGN